MHDGGGVQISYYEHGMTYLAKKIFTHQAEIQEEGVMQRSAEDEETRPWLHSIGLRRNKKKRDKRNGRDISMLETVEAAGGVNLVGDGWEELKIAVDSGATESV
eukprot:11092564-Karenia_brevis.AAC.1